MHNSPKRKLLEIYNLLKNNNISAANKLSKRKNLWYCGKCNKFIMKHAVKYLDISDTFDPNFYNYSNDYPIYCLDCDPKPYCKNCE